MEFPGHSRPARLVLSGVVVLPILAALVSGCGAGPEQIGLTGIDELVIPTPQPRAADFVAEIDNPFLPLQPGAVWVYESAGAGGGDTTTVTVTEETKTIQGVTMTVVRDVVRDESGAVVLDSYDWFAQDQRGNVWSFGEATTSYGGGEASTEGSWEAGVGGAQAGLVMAAVPRVGDGYEQEHLPGVAQDRARVIALDGEVSAASGDYAGLVVTEVSTPLNPGQTVTQYYARGTGLVLAHSGVAERTELVSYSSGDPSMTGRHAAEWAT